MRQIDYAVCVSYIDDKKKKKVLIQAMGELQLWVEWDKKYRY